VLEAGLVDEGFGVHPFKCCQAMFAAADEGLHADIVVLDWDLGSVPSIGTLSQMRTAGLRWPVVFVTAQNSPAHERIALQQGAADFVDKARGTAVLAARLRRIANQGGTGFNVASDDIFHCGRLTLRPMSHQAYWDGVDVGLTVSEFKIVRILASNVGSFVSYREIYDSMHHVGFIAGSGRDGYRINVRSAIKRLRDKFKAQQRDFDAIQTYNSFGYRWRKL
jgi:two-component system response regulator ChvI